jgi:hypothetical protein
LPKSRAVLFSAREVAIRPYEQVTKVSRSECKGGARLVSAYIPATSDSLPVKPGRALLAVNILIIVSLVVAVLLGGLVVETVTGGGPTIAIGSVQGTFSNGAMQLQVPIEIHNGGHLEIQGVEIALNVSDSAGHQLISGSSGSFNVAPQSVRSLNMTLTADMKALPQSEVNSLLTQDQHLQLRASLTASEQPLVSVNGVVAGTLPWGAILGNLTFGTSEVTPINSTYSQVVWHGTFSNRNQYFRLVANMTGDLKDASGSVVGRLVPVSLTVKRGTSFNGQLTALVLNSALGPLSSGHFTAELDIQQANLLQTQLSVVLNA